MAVVPQDKRTAAERLASPGHDLPEPRCTRLIKLMLSPIRPSEGRVEVLGADPGSQAAGSGSPMRHRAGSAPTPKGCANDLASRRR